MYDNGNGPIWDLIEIIIRLTPDKQNICLLFFQMQEKLKKAKNNNKITQSQNQNSDLTYDDFEELLFFLNTQSGLKTICPETNNELFEFIQGFLKAVVTKKEKSQITFFESKSVSHTNLCSMEGIIDSNTITWVENLMCIPGISENKAISIAKVFKSFPELMEVYNSNEFSEKEKLGYLKDVEVNNRQKGTVKKIGPAISQKVYKYYMAEDASSIV